VGVPSLVCCVGAYLSSASYYESSKWSKRQDCKLSGPTKITKKWLRVDIGHPTSEAVNRTSVEEASA